MTSGNLKYQFARLSIAEKLIVINLAVFILDGIIPFLLKLPQNSLSRWFELPKDLFDFIAQPWSIITYSFFHAGFWHLFWNMFMLYFSARIFLNLFGPRKLINVYFLGVICGGLLFLLSYNVFPAFLGR
ncbi:MAG: rhomboid family intramembrane serine protease, partial [Bacteroidota bacterium]